MKTTYVKEQLKQFSLLTFIFLLFLTINSSFAQTTSPTLSFSDKGGNGGDYESIISEYTKNRIDQLKNDYIKLANSDAFDLEYGHLNLTKDDYIRVINTSEISFSNKVLIDKLGEVRDALNFSDGSITFSDKNIEEAVNSKEFAVLFQHEHLNLLGIEINSFHESIKMWAYLDLITIAKVNTFKKDSLPICEVVTDIKLSKEAKGVLLKKSIRISSKPTLDRFYLLTLQNYQRTCAGSTTIKSFVSEFKVEEFQTNMNGEVYLDSYKVISKQKKINRLWRYSQKLWIEPMQLPLG